MFLYNKQEGVREDSLFCFLLRSIKFEYNLFEKKISLKTKKLCAKKLTHSSLNLSLSYYNISFLCFKNHYLMRPRFLRVALSNIKYLRYCFSERIVCMYFKSLLIALPTIASRSSAGAIAAFIISAVKFL